MSDDGLSGFQSLTMTSRALRASSFPVKKLKCHSLGVLPSFSSEAISFDDCCTHKTLCLLLGKSLDQITSQKAVLLLG
jgi:hypothetical protein